MATSHTPGPLELADELMVMAGAVAAATSDEAAGVIREAAAQLRMIAAAPELLAVLAAISRNPMAAPFLARQHMDEKAGAVNLAGQHINTSQTVWDALQAAIAKAEGR